jgi:CBS domain containing-hemolysin-like protein
VLARLGRAPEVDDRIDVDGYQLTVEGVEGARVSTIEIRDAE